MYFHPIRVIWVIWSLVWAAVWTVAAVHNVPHHACTVPTVFVINGQSCAQDTTVGNPALMIVFVALAVASVAAAFLPVGPGKIRRGIFFSAAKKTGSDQVAQLHKLQELRDAGLLSQQEYETKRAEVINSI